MSVELKKVVIGLEDDAFTALRALAEVNHDGELGAAGRELLTRCLLGEAHVLKLLAERFARAAKQGNTG